MYILALSVKDQEFFYKARTAHYVSKSQADVICKELNRLEYKLEPGMVWHIHQVDEYDSAYDFANCQKFYIRNGYLKEKRF